ncbi:MAG TPA: monovalent cation/H+ antiporter complex subunit F [Xanthobacteraceae bacterium]|jgi:multicomponent Na+:H+ antiporter subunit F|nr:monovalent cation/H+ antiporter complex subunit F [Xanthobacteraceae bacterium]
MTDPWLVTALALLPPLLLTAIAAGRTTVRYRLVAVEMATSLTIIMLIVLSFAFDQASSIDLALTVALLTLPGTLLLAQFEERWL